MRKIDRRLVPLARILTAAGERYVHHGTVKGNLQVPSLTEDERLALSGLLERYVPTRPGETLKLSLRTLEQALQNQAISADLPSAITQVTGRPVETRAEQAAARERIWTEFLTKVTRLGTGPRSRTWAESLASSPAIRREFQAAEPGLLEDLAAVAAALDKLPSAEERTRRRPVFAQELTGNPHGFDEDQRAGRLLLSALADLHGLPEPPASAMERGILLTSFGILPDGVSSTVAAFGLAGARRKDGTRDSQVAGAAHDLAVHVASLRQVGAWDALVTHSDTLFAVENPAVFEDLADAGAVLPSAPPLLCTAGFLSVAAVRVLDLAAAQGLQIRYGGDFDANGLAIAAGLIRRYGARVSLWGMSPADYTLAAEHPRSSPLSETEVGRLAQFFAPGHPLAPVATEMQRLGKKAYQEALIPRLREDYCSSQNI